MNDLVDEDIAKKSLNGAQTRSLIEVVKEARSGLLPRSSAIEIIRAAFPSVGDRAEEILGPPGIDRRREEDEE